MEHEIIDRIISYVKTLIGFASGAILIIANFIVDQSEYFESTLLQYFYYSIIIASILSFVIVIFIGLSCIRKIINFSIPDEEELQKNISNDKKSELSIADKINWINGLFITGFIFLLGSIVLNLIN